MLFKVVTNFKISLNHMEHNSDYFFDLIDLIRGMVTDIATFRFFTTFAPFCFVYCFVS